MGFLCEHQSSDHIYSLPQTPSRTPSPPLTVWIPRPPLYIFTHLCISVLFCSCFRNSRSVLEGFIFMGPSISLWIFSSLTTIDDLCHLCFVRSIYFWIQRDRFISQYRSGGLWKSIYRSLYIYWGKTWTGRDGSDDPPNKRKSTEGTFIRYNKQRNYVSHRDSK